MTDRHAIDAAIAALRAGGLIAYPTEAVWGLGCDPDNSAALASLIELKRRDPAKGVILVAGEAPALDGDAVRRCFGSALAAIVDGPLGGHDRPSTIRDLITDRILRD